MKKLLSTTIVVIMLLATLSGTVSAAAAEEYTFEPVLVNETSDSDSSTRAEQTVWYFTLIDGVPYKRLWSITYGKWLTDWIPAT
jgi:hypothetical protein